jgi:hypothetical protein
MSKSLEPVLSSAGTDPDYVVPFISGGFICAKHPLNGTQIFPFILCGPNPELTRDVAMKKAKERWPEKDGWINHHAGMVIANSYELLWVEYEEQISARIRKETR